MISAAANRKNTGGQPAKQVKMLSVLSLVIGVLTLVSFGEQSGGRLIQKLDDSCSVQLRFTASSARWQRPQAGGLRYQVSACSDLSGSDG